MRIYLSAAWADRDRVRWLAGWIEKQGHTVVSTWHERDYPQDAPQSWWAAVDLAEVEKADALVVFCLDITLACRGEMDFEAGYAFAHLKRLYWIGKEPRNVFMERYGEPWMKSIPAADMSRLTKK